MASHPQNTPFLGYVSRDLLSHFQANKHPLPNTPKFIVHYENVIPYYVTYHLIKRCYMNQETKVIVILKIHALEFR
jgi:hypothetical protein